MINLITSESSCTKIKVLVTITNFSWGNYLLQKEMEKKITSRFVDHLCIRRETWGQHWN